MGGPSLECGARGLFSRRIRLGYRNTRGKFGDAPVGRNSDPAVAAGRIWGFPIEGSAFTLYRFRETHLPCNRDGSLTRVYRRRHIAY